MAPLGTKAPFFRLPDAAGKWRSIDDFKAAPALLVAFICNHCPFVKHIRAEFAEVARRYQQLGVAVVGISSNDVEQFPEDGPEKMAEEARTYGYDFPYLFDESQDVAKAYGAACTPDFFLYDKDRKLVYRGQFDDSRPESGVPVTGKDLKAALDAALQGHPAAAEQRPSIGCNIKWKTGNEPEYARSTVK
jgi:peroxiredoxin